MGAVVHGDHRHGILAGLEPLEQQRRHHAHGVTGMVGAFVNVGLHHRHQAAVRTVQRVALLGDGEGQHLQAGVGEDLLQAGHHLRLGGVDAQTLGHRADDLPAGGAVGVQRDVHGQAVEGGVDFVDDVIVKGIAHDDALVGQALVEQPLLERRHKAAENVAAAEMHPDGMLFGGLHHGLMVEFRQGNALGLPFGFLVDDGCCVHLHNDTLL